MNDSRGVAARPGAAERLVARPTSGASRSGEGVARHGGPGRRALEAVARRAGIAVSYLDQGGQRRRVSSESLFAVLSALGQAVAEEPGPGAGSELPGVVLAWDGRAGAISLPGRRQVRAELVADRAGSPGAALPAVRALERGGKTTIELAGKLPYGVHELHVHSGRDEPRVVQVLSAPRRAGAPKGWQPGGWGLFAPAYSLRDERERPAGDLTSLRRLGELAASHGASIVATLPMLAELSAAEGGERQSPYSPLTRMWWNEAYLDPARLPELAGIELPPSLAGGRRPAPARAGSPLVGTGSVADLSRVAAELRPLLAEGARRLASTAGRGALSSFVSRRPDVGRYARFRAALELQGPDRSRWPASWRAGRIGSRAVPAEAVARHTYAQLAMDRQLAEDAASLAVSGCGYLLDLPVGCRPDGYDPWAYPDAFSAGASVGAPPDLYFPEGQDWGFPPPHPEGDRRAGYPMLRACLSHHLAHAAALRIDHVLGWSRLWWVPAGMPSSAGAYVHYRLEELLAVACLESWRHSARLIGEDLGTVEPQLQRALRRHHVAGMRVAVFDLDAAPDRPLEPPASSVAYVDTHDTATFAGFLGGEELELRRSLGLLGDEAARAAGRVRARQRRLIEQRLRAAGRLGRSRSTSVREVLAAVLDELGSSPAELVVVNLEDLWEETDPHNVPGTSGQHVNFARRFGRELSLVGGDRALIAVLDRLDAARRGEAHRHDSLPDTASAAGAAEASRGERERWPDHDDAHAARTRRREPR